MQSTKRPHCSAALEITLSVARRQLAAMGCERFELGVLRADGVMLLRDRMSAERICAMLGWLRYENARGAHIFVRPQGPSRLSLIDDLGRAAITIMKRLGFEPALLVETSPGNFQVWLKHERVLDPEQGTVAAKELAQRFGGDLSSASWRHFGRLAGFTNQKPIRRLPNRLAPFVRLRESPGLIFSQAERFLKLVKQRAERARLERETRLRSWSGVTTQSTRSLTDFHHDPRYEGDLHRADMAWATYAALHGFSAGEIAATIGAARDLSKKGNLQRQLAYAERTAMRALLNLTMPVGNGAPGGATH